MWSYIVRGHGGNSVFHPSGGSRKLYNLLNLHSIYSHEAELLLNSNSKSNPGILKSFVFRFEKEATNFSNRKHALQTFQFQSSLPIGFFPVVWKR